jgi:hypothetical protein
MMIEIFKAPLVRVIAFSNETGSFEKDQAITWMLCLKKVWRLQENNWLYST